MRALSSGGSAASRMRHVVAIAVTIAVSAPLVGRLTGAEAGSALRCTVLGTAGDDVLRGTSRGDVLCGRDGNDTISGRGGNDVLVGGGGNDALYPGPGTDRVLAGAGSDLVFSSDGRRELVDAGAGFDRGRVDRRERTRNLERRFALGAGRGRWLIAAGDIADCTRFDARWTAPLLDAFPSATVATLGDHAYPDGTPAEFARCYAPTWGRAKARTRPSPGNHDYETAGATGYFSYFASAAGDPRKGFYSYDLGRWHVVSLNSNCTFVACGRGSPQERWLRADLAGHRRKCTLAYWHHPRFSSGKHRDEPAVRALWQALYDHDVDVALAGHDHSYERLAPLNASGRPDPARGIREIIVGTGGASFHPFTTVVRGSEVRNNDTFGVLKLTLRASSYSWEFVPVAGGTFTDSGSGACH